MTTLNFIARLSPWLLHSDRGTRPDAENAALLQAINKSAGEWAGKVDAGERLLPGNMLADGSVTKTVTVTTGSNVIAGLSTADIGQVITIGDDPTPNHALSATVLRLPYLGTTGSQSATVQRNSVLLPASTVSVREVSAILTGKTMPLAEKAPESVTVTGTPEAWTVESLPYFHGRQFLRIWPVPVGKVNIIYTAEHRPQRWIVTDLQVSRELEFGERWEEIVPYVVRELLGTTLLKPDVSADLIMAACERSTVSVPDPRPSVTIGTPEGW